MIKNFFSYFDEVYVINLPEERKKLETFMSRFSKYIPNIRVFPAIKHEVGWRGCGKSHQAIIKSAKTRNLDNVFIFEDDCMFLDADRAALNQMKAHITKNEWQTVRLSYNYIDDYVRSFSGKSLSPLPSLRRFGKNVIAFKKGCTVGNCCAVGYHKSTFDEIVNNFNPDTDNVCDANFSQKFETACVFPMQCIQDQDDPWPPDSRIDKKIPKKQYLLHNYKRLKSFLRNEGE